MDRYDWLLYFSIALLVLSVAGLAYVLFSV